MGGSLANDMLRYISQTAVDHGIDFTLGVWEHNIQDYRKPHMLPMTEGLTPENIAPIAIQPSSLAGLPSD